MEQTGVPPLAYSFVKNGLLHTEMNWLQTEDALFANTIGKSLVDFAYIDDESLRVVMMEIDSALLNMTDKRLDKAVIAGKVMEKYLSVFQTNLYFSVYLMGCFDYSVDGIIDTRVFPGTTDADCRLLKAANRGDLEAIMTIPDLIFKAYQAKRQLIESTLKKIYEDQSGDGLTPLERYYQYEQKDPQFQKQFGASFTVHLRRQKIDDCSVIQTAELDTVDDLLRYELFLLVTQGKGYKFCKNCGKPFIPDGRSDKIYCDRIMKGGDKRCSEIGANLTEQRKVAQNPIWKAYRTAYQRLHKRLEMGYMQDEEYAVWKDAAAQKRDLCLAGKLSEEEYLDWINRTSRQR